MWKIRILYNWWKIASSMVRTVIIRLKIYKTLKTNDIWNRQLVFSLLCLEELWNRVFASNRNMKLSKMNLTWFAILQKTHKGSLGHNNQLWRTIRNRICLTILRDCKWVNLIQGWQEIRHQIDREIGFMGTPMPFRCFSIKEW